MKLLFHEIASEVINLACQIQQIPSPTFQEGERAQFMAQRFQSLGLSDVQIDPTGNVLARLPGAMPLSETTPPRPLLLSAHLDTVHPLTASLDLKRTPERIMGRGIGDNALGLAALVCTPAWFMTHKIQLPGDLWLVANVCEEGLGDLRGMQAITNRFGSQPLAYLVLEGIGLGNILHRGLGVDRYKITIETPGGHSWGDFGAPSAIHILCDLVTRLSNLPLSKDPRTTLNVGVIQGGTSVNTIAAQASIELDLRSEDETHLKRLADEVHNLVRGLRRSPVRSSIKRIGKRQAGWLPADHPLIRTACNVLEELDITPHLDIASTDANLPLSQGYPAICLGITNGNYAHAADEYILTSPVHKGMAQLLTLIQRAWQYLS